jgi:uncharacterized protein DUF3303
MLFAVLYSWKPTVDDDDARKTRHFFTTYEPPHGIEIFAHYAYTRGGGIVLIETDDASLLYEALIPFRTTIDFELEPIVKVIKALAIARDVDEWVDSFQRSRGSR